MEKFKIITVVGARPQFIKAAVVSRAIAQFNSGISSGNRIEIPIIEHIIHTGQHFDENMSDIFFREMDIPKPLCNLNINKLNHGAMTGQMLEKIEEILMGERPDIVLIYGDTNSTLAGALAAKKLNIKVAHVEAGLRSFNMQMPEEINRILADRISDILFCPTEQAINNLANEGIPNKLPSAWKQIAVNVGDVMYDAAVFYEKNAQKPQSISETQSTPFILATIHRAENTDIPDKFKDILDALIELSKESTIIFPVHPRTQTIINLMGHPYDKLFSPSAPSPKRQYSIMAIPPASYFEMIWLIKNSSLVVTDSGGLQKEAYFFRKKCITLREETEWVELVDNGYNVIAGHRKNDIISAHKNIVKVNPDFSKQLYGKGDSGTQIVNFLSAYLK